MPRGEGIELGDFATGDGDKDEEPDWAGWSAHLSFIIVWALMGLARRMLSSRGQISLVQA